MDIHTGGGGGIVVPVTSPPGPTSTGVLGGTGKGVAGVRGPWGWGM